MAVWFAINGGDWNGNPAADPATNIGGVSLSFVAGQALFPTVQVNAGATGDSVTANFGGSAFAHAVPSGFSAVGAGVTLDPASVVHGALSGGNLHLLETGIGTGGAQATSGFTSGKRYFEVTLTSIAGSSAHVTGCGVGRAGVSYDQFATGSGAGAGRFSGGDPNGGASLGRSGAGQSCDIGAGGSTVVSAMGTASPGAVIRVAFVPEGVATPEAKLAEFWFSPTSEFIDLSDEANRRKFIDDSGCTQFLGSDGSLPFGVPPSVYLAAAVGNAAAFASNLGLGGPFAITGGSLALTGDRPCCGSVVTINPPNTPQGADPMVRLSVSDDGGRTFSTLQKERSLGKLGHYLQRLRWLKMGQFRQRVIRLEITDPVRRNFVGFYFDLSDGLK